MKFLGTITDAGGGCASIIVDRDLDQYPEAGTPVYLDDNSPTDKPSLARALYAQQADSFDKPIRVIIIRYDREGTPVGMDTSTWADEKRV